MTRLNLSTNNLSQVPPQLLAGPLLRVEILCTILVEVNWMVSGQVPQLTALSNITGLRMGTWPLDNLLAEGIVCLQEVALYETTLASQQVKILFLIV